MRCACAPPRILRITRRAVTGMAYNQAWESCRYILNVRRPDTMAEEAVPPPTPPARSKDEVALELMKFIAVSTGYGKGGTAAGYGATPKSTRTPEEYAEALLELFERCRTVV